MHLLFVDVETNDHPRQLPELRIVTITWMIAQPNEFIEKIENHIIRPDGFRIADGARMIHGVSEQQARQYGRPIKEILQRLASDLQSIDELAVIGHNVDFDRKVIGSEFSRHGFNVDIFKFPFICTMQSATSICRIPRANGSGYKYPKLQELYLHLFGGNFSDAHTSKADVEATARCYFELTRRGLLPMPSGRERKSPDNIQNKKRRERKSSVRPEISSDDDVQFHSVNSAAYQQEKKEKPKYADMGLKTIVNCPRCGQRLRVPAGKLLDIKCRPCGRVFRKFTV